MPIVEKTQEKIITAVDYGLVSIIMPNYNSEKYVEATVKSVLAQTYEKWELLLVDDCSQDDSLEIVRAFRDERIKILSTEKNGGAAAARNIAIEKAQGRWIAFLDSDDLWTPDKLEKQISYMAENQIAFSYSDYAVVNEEGERVYTFKPKLGKCNYRDILKHCHIGCLTAVYDTERLGKVYMPTDAPKREDLACWLSILKNGVEAHCLHETLAEYKVHTGSVSSNKLSMIRYQWQVYRRVEGIGLFSSLYYLVCWAINGFFKYRK